MSIAIDHFLFRVAGVFIKERKVLLHMTKNGRGWVLPGGKAEVNELTTDTIIREFEEELGYTVKVDRLLWIIENFNAYGVPELHEHGMYYAVEAPGVIVQDATFTGKEELGIRYQWVNIDEFDHVNIYPKALVTLIREMAQTDGIKHVMNNDLE